MLGQPKSNGNYINALFQFPDSNLVKGFDPDEEEENSQGSLSSSTDEEDDGEGNDV
jgi:hypothetical protein